jgi:hypothetical protein
MARVVTSVKSDARRRRPRDTTRLLYRHRSFRSTVRTHPKYRHQIGRGGGRGCVGKNDSIDARYRRRHARVQARRDSCLHCLRRSPSPSTTTRLTMSMSTMTMMMMVLAVVASAVWAPWRRPTVESTRLFTSRYSVENTPVYTR